MIVLVNETAIFTQVPGIVSNFTAIFLVLKNFVLAAGRVIVSVVNNQPDFPSIAVLSLRCTEPVEGSK